MDIKRILSHINDKMIELSEEDERTAVTWAVHGHGGPSYRTSKKLDMYNQLLELFTRLEGSRKGKVALECKEQVLCEFFDWFLNMSVEWSEDEERYIPIPVGEKKKDDKVNSRFDWFDFE